MGVAGRRLHCFAACHSCIYLRVQLGRPDGVWSPWHRSSLSLSGPTPVLISLAKLLGSSENSPPRLSPGKTWEGFWGGLGVCRRSQRMCFTFGSLPALGMAGLVNDQRCPMDRYTVARLASGGRAWRPLRIANQT